MRTELESRSNLMLSENNPYIQIDVDIFEFFGAVVLSIARGGSKSHCFVCSWKTVFTGVLFPYWSDCKSNLVVAGWCLQNICRTSKMWTVRIWYSDRFVASRWETLRSGPLSIQHLWKASSASTVHLSCARLCRVHIAEQKRSLIVHKTNVEQIYSRQMTLWTSLVCVQLQQGNTEWDSFHFRNLSALRTKFLRVWS